MAQDLKLTITDEGYFDITIGEQDIDSVDGMETTVAVLLFTDARAAPSEVLEPEKRRGWLGNLLQSSELGGMLWLIEQMRNEQTDRNKITIWAENSLQPLIDEGDASGVVVLVTQTDTRIISLSIEIIVGDGSTQKFKYWINTDLSNLILEDPTNGN